MIDPAARPRGGLLAEGVRFSLDQERWARFRGVARLFPRRTSLSPH